MPENIQQKIGNGSTRGGILQKAGKSKLPNLFCMNAKQSLIFQSETNRVIIIIYFMITDQSTVEAFYTRSMYDGLVLGVRVKIISFNGNIMFLLYQCTYIFSLHVWCLMESKGIIHFYRGTLQKSQQNLISQPYIYNPISLNHKKV